jgi:hypothetical protein
MGSNCPSSVSFTFGEIVTDVPLVTTHDRVMNSPAPMEVELAVKTTVGAVDKMGAWITALRLEPQSLKRTASKTTKEATRNFVTHDI